DACQPRQPAFQGLEQRTEKPDQQCQNDDADKTDGPVRGEGSQDDLHGYPPCRLSTISMRLLRSRPSGVVLGAIGSASALPSALNREASPTLGASIAL